MSGVKSQGRARARAAPRASAPSAQRKADANGPGMPRAVLPQEAATVSVPVPQSPKQRMPRTRGRLQRQQGSCYCLHFPSCRIYHFDSFSSFFIAPLNYFDSDVSLDSLNAVLLTPPSAPGEPYLHDDYGVDQGTTCIPDPPSPFTYTDVHAYDMDGGKVFGADLKKLQTMAYAPHRIMVEL